MDNPTEYIIAIGASAGGLEPIQEIVSSLPEDLNDASIIIAQHLSPSYKSLLAQLIAKKTVAPVLTIEDGMRIRGNTIYVIPPDRHVIIRNSAFQFSNQTDLHPKPNVDLLFKSVSEEYGANTVGIVLSGTGIDGSEGVKAINKKGGKTICQDLNSCKYTGMPQAAFKTEIIDFVLSPKEIGENLFKILKGEYIEELMEQHEDDENDSMSAQTEVFQILSLLEKKTGVDFQNYKKSTINRRLEKRMQFKKIPDITSYIKHILHDPTELEELFKEVLIGVTKFYRDKEVFQDIDPIFSKIIDNSKSRQIRIWVAGCASGEEVYSIAISLMEAARAKGIMDLPMQIFGTDIDQNALNHARLGYYKKDVLDEVPDELIDRYFTKHQDGYVVNNELKKGILFSKHDVTANPPFLKLDLISCRNLLIYFDNDLQKQVIPVFHYALNNDGHLVLGKSESVSNFKNLFTTVHAKNKIFLKKPVDKRLYSFPQLKSVKTDRIVPANSNLKHKNLTISDMVKETIYNTFEHPYVVVDEDLDMLEVNSDTSKYLQFKSGTVSTNILKVIVSDLQIELRAMAGQAIRDNTSIKGNLRRFKPVGSNNYEYVRLSIKPLLFSKPILPYYIIIFEQFDIDEGLARDLNIPSTTHKEDPRILQLEQELESTKEHMNTLIEELETSNEELQSTNEELQSSNEELQASNEELETSNEELQATNEELEIAYTEIRKASDHIEIQKSELALSGKRLDALFNSTIQGHVLIESNYNIKMFNETAQECYEKLFNQSLMVDKSFVDYIPTDKFKEFHDRFQKALNGTANEGVIKYEGEVYYSYVYIPINKNKDIDSESVLISFHDITKEQRAENRLKLAYKLSEEQKNLWHQLFVNAPHNIAILSAEDYTIDYVNPNFEKLFGKQNLKGTPIIDLIPNNRKTLFGRTLREVTHSNKPLHVVEFPFYDNITKDDKDHCSYFNITCSVLLSNSGKNRVVIFATDVTQQVEARKIKETSHQLVTEENKKFLRLFDDSPLFIAKTEGIDHTIMYANPHFKNYFPNRNITEFSITNALPEIQKNGYVKVLNYVYNSGKTFVGNEVQLRIESSNGKTHIGYYNLVCHARKDKDGKVEGVTILGYEVTDLVKARNTIQQRADSLFMLSELMPQKVFTCDKNGLIDYNNSRMLEYTGLNSEELIGENSAQIIHSQDLELTSKKWKESLEKKSEFQLKHRLKSVDDEYLWHLTRAIPVLDRDQNIVKWIGTSTDIHDQVTAEKKKDEFLNIASHELKTPLTTIIAYTDLLKELPSLKDDTTALAYLERSQKNQNRLKSLISDLLDVTRIQSGNLSLVKKRVNYGELIHSILENISKVYTSHKIEVEGNVDITIKLDEFRIEQVLSNLISNAVKYSDKNGRVLVKLEANKNEIITSVQDFGIGIPKNKQKYIFNRFYRVQNSDTSTTGLGIGLYITSQLINAHKGKVWLKSALGEGSTFYFSLPIKKSE